MSSFWEEMSIIRQRRLDREKQQARGVLASIKSAITNGIASSVNSASSGLKPIDKVKRFNSTKPARPKVKSLGQLECEWLDLVQAEMQLSKCDPIRASSIVAKKHPALRQQMIESANREKGRRR